MSLKRKLEGEVEVHAAAADAFHDMYSNRPHHAPNMSPHFLQGCEFHEGELGSPGYVITWKYTIDGKSYVAKNVIEEIDNEKKLVRQSVTEGDLLKEYKTFTGTCQVIPKDKETSLVRWTMEYEKLHPGVPEPTGLLDSLLGNAKDTHDHHIRENK